MIQHSRSTQAAQGFCAQLQNVRHLQRMGSKSAKGERLPAVGPSAQASFQRPLLSFLRRLLGLLRLELRLLRRLELLRLELGLLRVELGLRLESRLRPLPPPGPPDLRVPHFIHSAFRAKLWKSHLAQSQSPGRNSTFFGLAGGLPRSRLLLPLGDRLTVSINSALIACALFLPACGSSTSNSTLSPLLKPLFFAL